MSLGLDKIRRTEAMDYLFCLAAANASIPSYKQLVMKAMQDLEKFRGAGRLLRENRGFLLENFERNGLKKLFGHH